jgi:UDP-GlcNAc:undecaprenyl-phosphate/decaprenyl-phosphate GlcNAc-1-phosphate transferase
VTPEGAEALPLALAGLVLAALVAFLLTPVAVRLATAVGAIDHPGERRVHQEETPRGGGLAVAAGFVIVGLAVLWYDRQDALTELAFHHPSQEIAVLFGGAVAAAILGFIDDRLDLRARWQFLGQLVLAGLVVWSGLEVDFVANPFAVGKIPLTGVFAVGFTAFWIVGMINSINWIDGLDGLSSGVAAIAAATLGGISLFVTPAEPLVGVLCFILAGALAGFLPWNFHPARIFVGTTGVFLIGYTLAVLSILGTAKVAVALLVLGVPIIDTFWIIVRRVAQGSSPFAPDRGHLHHRLLDLGLGQRQVVVLIYGMSAVLAVLSFLLSGRGQLYAFMGIVVGGGLVLYLLTTRAGDTSTTGLDASAYEEAQANGPGRVKAPGGDRSHVRGETRGEDAGAQRDETEEHADPARGEEARGEPAGATGGPGSR